MIVPGGAPKGKRTGNKGAFVSMDRDFVRQLDGYSLATVEIHYYLPDHPSLLQQFIWQTYDLAPHFPALARFLDHWRREIEAPLHSIRVAHSRLLGPTEWRAVDGVISIQ
jgi:uncharacterized protein Usg